MIPPATRYRIKFYLADGTSRYAMRWGHVDLRTAEELAQYQPVVDGINAGHIQVGFSRDGEIFTTPELWTEMLGLPIEEFVPVVRVEVEAVEGGPSLRVTRP